MQLRFGNETGGSLLEEALLEEMKAYEGSLFPFPSFLSSGVYAVLRHQEAKRDTRFSARILTLDPPYTSSVHLASFRMCGEPRDSKHLPVIFFSLGSSW